MVDLKLELPKEFFEEEIRDGYLVSSEMKKVWAVELDLLNEFMRVCDKYNIKYFTAAGTTMGAVRHHGFIPWDDDIDVMLIREEYQKLEEVALKEFQAPYFWQTELTDSSSARGHAQLRNNLTTGILVNELEGKYKFNQGIFIDIFPIEYIPDDRDGRKRFFCKLEKKKRILEIYSAVTLRYQKKKLSIKQLVKNMTHFVLMIGMTERIQYKVFRKLYDDFEQSIQEYNKKHTNMIGYLVTQPVKEKCVWNADWLESTVEVPFEVLNVPVPVGYNRILTKQYGESWKTPSHQPTVHGDIIFDTEKSYLEYIIVKK